MQGKALIRQTVFLNKDKEFRVRMEKERKGNLLKY